MKEGMIRHLKFKIGTFWRVTDFHRTKDTTLFQIRVFRNREPRQGPGIFHYRKKAGRQDAPRAAYRYSCAYPQYSPKCSRAKVRIRSYSRAVRG